ncbi:major intrinsically disordered NOTCH2-binding receptor 1-like [Oncorhynchus tshawytscha]|uniref:Major intrinsically disordered Notch2-binding receptor 1-like C-terminal domain-containing protein n=1 Tax=Oncorhynchus tshawytscha TaxID=74940 RepID=A0AAZ3PK61_ONCTS|nr:major intrinsically disordered NOTCH2-binding receptor 1-like [Oncorhynchus tshawytscha]
MDISVLPNNNHPEKLFQLDVGMLPATHGMFQVEAALSGQRQWSNQVYQQRERRTVSDNRPSPSPEGSPVVFVDRYLEKHITPHTLNSKIKRNPLYTDIRTIDMGENQKSKPSWTIQEFDRHSIHSNLAGYLKEEEKGPQDLDFWLEDLYTPGYDSLLKKKEAQMKRNRLCKILTYVILSVCVIIIIITVPIVVTRSVKKP